MRRSLPALIGSGEVILTEGSVYELLRRDRRIVFDQQIAHAGLIYDDDSRGVLESVHRGYLAIAESHGLPMLLLTDTWRASGARVAASRFRDHSVNADNVAFLRDLAGSAFVGALTGPKGNAYRPQEAPSEGHAAEYHATQIEDLARAGADLLMAATLPAIPEAKGIARRMSDSGVPWMLSFVVRPGGRLLDGTPLGDAIHAIDDGVPSPPLGYSINCVHATIAGNALAMLPEETRRRVIAVQANTSRRTPEELDGLAALDCETPAAFAAAAGEVVRRTSVRIIGGCCGSGQEHIEALARALDPARGTHNVW
jgi:homocysteine S-methyltransferase